MEISFFDLLKMKTREFIVVFLSTTGLIKIFYILKMFSERQFNRPVIASMCLKGKGIEIGALAHPLTVPSCAKVKYVDRMTNDELRKQYGHLKYASLAKVSFVDDGEKLSSFQNESQDFVIANHFFEHCENPIQTLKNILRILRKDGTIFMAIPDKRYTFDSDRTETSVEHLLRDFREGPEWSKRSHFEEWVKIVSKVSDRIEAEKKIEELINNDYSIHFHAWTSQGLIDFFITLKNELGLDFEIEHFSKYKNEAVFVMKKI